MSYLRKRIEKIEKASPVKVEDWRDWIREHKRSEYVLAWNRSWQRGLSAEKIAEIKMLSATRFTDIEHSGATPDEIIAEIEHALGGT